MVRGRRGPGWARWGVAGVLWLAAACTAAAPREAAPASAPAAATPTAATASAASAPPSTAPAAGARPALATAPVVDLKVNALPIAAWAPYYIAQERGYFREVGLNVEFAITSNTA